MFYKTELKDHIRVDPKYLGEKIEKALLKSIKQKFTGYIDPDLGIVVDVLDLRDINEGIIIPGDGAPYYESVFEVITFKPELQEVVLAKVRDIADFGAFMNLGPIDGMIHISQTMDDFVSFSKDKALQGKESNRSLKVGDLCRARIIANSFKDITNPKLGLTMRQEGLGKFEWLKENKENKENKEKKEKKEKKENTKA